MGDFKGELKGISIAETFKGESLTHFPSKELEKGKTRRKKIFLLRNKGERVNGQSPQS